MKGGSHDVGAAEDALRGVGLATVRSTERGASIAPGERASAGRIAASIWIDVSEGRRSDAAAAKRVADAFVSVIILSASLSAYALAANRARAWMRSSRAMGIARKTAAGVMAGAALAIVTR